MASINYSDSWDWGIYILSLMRIQCKNKTMEIFWRKRTPWKWDSLHQTGSPHGNIYCIYTSLVGKQYFPHQASRKLSRLAKKELYKYVCIFWEVYLHHYMISEGQASRHGNKPRKIIERALDHCQTKECFLTKQPKDGKRSQKLHQA